MWSPGPGQCRNQHPGTSTPASRKSNPAWASPTPVFDDFEIQRAVEDAAAWIEQFTGRYFWNGTGTRTYRNTSIYDMEIDDLISVTQLLATDADGDGVYEDRLEHHPVPA